MTPSPSLRDLKLRPSQQPLFLAQTLVPRERVHVALVGHGGLLAVRVRRQTGAALATPALEHGPTAAGLHPRAEAVGALTLDLTRLVRPLHDIDLISFIRTPSTLLTGRKPGKVAAATPSREAA